MEESATLMCFRIVLLLKNRSGGRDQRSVLVGQVAFLNEVMLRYCVFRPCLAASGHCACLAPAPRAALFNATRMHARGSRPAHKTWEPEPKCDLASNLNRARFRLYAGNHVGTRGRNQKLCIFPRSRLRITLKAGSKSGAVKVGSEIALQQYEAPARTHAVEACDASTGTSASY